MAINNGGWWRQISLKNYFRTFIFAPFTSYYGLKCAIADFWVQQINFVRDQRYFFRSCTTITPQLIRFLANLGHESGPNSTINQLTKYTTAGIVQHQHCQFETGRTFKIGWRRQKPAGRESARGETPKQSGTTATTTGSKSGGGGEQQSADWWWCWRRTRKCETAATRASFHFMRPIFIATPNKNTQIRYCRPKLFPGSRMAILLNFWLTMGGWMHKFPL